MQTNAIKNQSKVNKYNIGDKAYIVNVNMQSPLVVEFLIVGIITNDEGLFYSADRNAWVKEEFLHISRKEAYRCLISQAEGEMNSPEGMQK